MKIRFFGSKNCKDCLKVFVILEKFQLDYDYFDGHDIENDDVYNMCEDQHVEELPHLQFLEGGKVVVEHVGPITEHAFATYIEIYFN